MRHDSNVPRVLYLLTGWRWVDRFTLRWHYLLESQLPGGWKQEWASESVLTWKQTGNVVFLLGMMYSSKNFNILSTFCHVAAINTTFALTYSFKMKCLISDVIHSDFHFIIYWANRILANIPFRAFNSEPIEKPCYETHLETVHYRTVFRKLIVFMQIPLLGRYCLFFWNHTNEIPRDGIDEMLVEMVR
jgi:hypothetical protein